MAIPLSLENSLREGRVVPFVGAGVSMAILGRETHEPLFPSWRQLLIAAARRLDDEQKPNDANLVRTLLEISEPDLLDSARRARSSLGPAWYDFLKQQLDIPRGRVEDESLELARSVWQLGSNLVITTNYDEVLEWACPHADLQTWDIEAPAEQIQLLQGRLRRPTVWHLHGSISNAAEIILTRDAYTLLYPDQDVGVCKLNYTAALETLRNQVASKTLLFLGFSLDDEYFGMQLRGVDGIFKGAAGPHYVLVREADQDRVRQLGLPVEILTVSDFGAPLITRLQEFAAIGNSSRTVSSQLQESTSIGKAPVVDYGPHRSVFFVPFRQKGDQIVGQEDALLAVHKQLTEGRPTAIGQTAAFRGLGGLGKTQLAVEYAYRYRDYYPNGVIWINADQDIDAQLIDIADKARWIAPESEHKHKLQISQQRIRGYSDCLIIFDNLEDRNAIDAYLPEPDANPHVLVTSRSDHAGFVPIPLKLLDEQLSLELLIQESQRTPASEDEQAAALTIARDLGGLPLAIELAGAYLQHKPDVTFRRYHELLGKDLKTAMPRSLSSFTKHEADLYHTLRLSEELFEEDQRLRDVLDLLTWSGSAPMSIGLMLALLDVPNEAELVNSLALGTALRLLQRSEASDSYSLHRLVGEVRREEIPLEERKDWVDAVCRRIGDWFQERRETFSQLTSFEGQIDHLKAWQINALRFSPQDASRLMWLQAYPAYHRGRYAESREYVREAKRIFDKVGETDRELEANLLNDLASTNSALGDFGSVLKDETQALKIRLELFGAQHRDIAKSLSNLSQTYGRGGDIRIALDYSEQALAMRRDLFGQQHPDIASSLNNVGSWYGEQGDLDRALDYSEQALVMRRDLFGQQHPDIASSLSNVGSWYGEQGDLDRALDYSEQALVMRRDLFGQQHPDIASSLSNVGSWYGQQGDLDRALEYSDQALVMHRDLFGQRHPDIASSLSNIGTWYGQQGDLERALEYSEQALAMRRDLFGQQHPDIASSLNNVGSWYGEQGDLDRALDYSEQALAMRRDLFGQRHPDVASSLNSVGYWYRQQSDLDRALDYLEQALAMRRDLFGQRHPDIATSLNNVGSCYGPQGDLDRALEYSEQALVMHRDLFGQRHPDIASSLSNVGYWYGQQGDLDRALEYSEQALAMRRDLFGQRHPDIANSLSNVGYWYGEQPDLDRALDYSEQALAMRRDLFGQRHPTIATSLNNVGAFHGERGDIRRALEYAQEAFAMWRELFGDLHPTTANAASSVADFLMRSNRRPEAYRLVLAFLAKLPSKHPGKEALKDLERQLLSQTIQKGFRQPSKKGKAKRKKKRN